MRLGGNSKTNNGFPHNYKNNLQSQAQNYRGKLFSPGYKTISFNRLICLIYAVYPILP